MKPKKEENFMGRDMANRANWEKTNLRSFTLKLNRANEKDVINHLERMPNKREYLIRLIREDIARSGS